MSPTSLRDRIVDTALELAEQASWESVRLHQVAAALRITLDEVRVHFREKEEIVDAWFDRADAAMLGEAARPEMAMLTVRERSERTLMAWLKALAMHRRPTRQMVANKFEPGHAHYQFSGLLRVSRTVQWWREAAGCTAALPWRAFEEVGYTSVYLATFAYWMFDESEDTQRTATFLHRLLGRVEDLGKCCARSGSEPSATQPDGDARGRGHR